MCSASGSTLFQGVEDQGWAEQFRQDQRCLARLVQHINGYAAAAQFGQSAGDRWISSRPVGPHQADVLAFKFTQHIGVAQRGLFVQLASHTPSGGEVDKHRLPSIHSIFNCQRGPTLPGCAGRAAGLFKGVQPGPSHPGTGQPSRAGQKHQPLANRFGQTPGPNQRGCGQQDQQHGHGGVQIGLLAQDP